MRNILVVLLVLTGVLLGSFAQLGAIEASGPVYHVVQPGETLYSIAALYGASPWAITYSNRLANSNYIFPGEVLLVPYASYPRYGYPYYGYSYYRPPSYPQPARATFPSVGPNISQPIAAPSNAPQIQAASLAGSDSSNPANVFNNWQTLYPGASVWVKLGSGGNHIVAYLDASPLNGVTMQVFAPGVLDRPIGQGAFDRSSGRLVWAGGQWNSIGDWIARITNNNSVPTPYNLSVTTSVIGQCDSISYWEKIGGTDVYWTRCK